MSNFHEKLGSEDWLLADGATGTNLFNMGLKFYDRIPFELYIRPQLSSYLDSVLGGLKWHMENNKPTPKNHFGTHKWFSK